MHVIADMNIVITQVVQKYYRVMGGLEAEAPKDRETERNNRKKHVYIQHTRKSCGTKNGTVSSSSPSQL